MILRKRILRVLRHGSYTATQIAKRLKVTPAHSSSVLNRMYERHEVSRHFLELRTPTYRGGWIYRR